MSKQIISTENAPAAIGSYSQAVKVSGVLYVSGQIPLVPETGEMVSNDFTQQARQAFSNLQQVIEAADFCLSDVVKLTIFVTDLEKFALVNEVMQTFFDAPYPARAVVQVSRLPKDAQIEMDAIVSA